MKRKINIADWPREIMRQTASILPNISASLAVLGVEVSAAAREKIGHYQPEAGPMPAWAPLAASTVAEKTRLGYAPPDNPLLRTGEMRASISFQVDGLTLRVGSTDPVMRYQELGTDHIPPRPAISSALFEAQPVVASRLGAALAKSLGASDVAESPIREAAE